MDRTQKTKILDAIRSGVFSADCLEPVPDVVEIFQETDGFYRFQNTSPIFGMPEDMTVADYVKFQEKFKIYCEAMQKIGLPEPILVIFEEKKSTDEPILN